MPTSLKRILLFIFVQAIIFAIITTLIISKNVFKYSITSIEDPVPVSNITKIFFHDLDKDGESERIKIYNTRKVDDTFHINIYKNNKGLINQWNIKDSILVSFIAFADLDRDNCEEVVVWSQGRDSLYLSIININQFSNLSFKDKFVLKGSDLNRHKTWDIENLDVKYSENIPGMLYFFLRSGYSRYPRGVYRFDLTKGKIINKFESPASFTQLALFDINNDHKEEIILGSTATDNFPDSVAFSDVYSWIFVMDQKLDKLFVQKSINRYGGSWFITAFDETMPVLYGLNIYKERNLKIIKVDHSLEIKDSLFIKGYVAGDYWLDDSNHFNVFLKGWDKRSLVKFDPALNIVDAKELEIPVDTEIRSIDDIDNDGLKNYYLRTMSTLFLLDENFDKIAEIKLGEDERLDDISILRQKRKNNILGINTTKYSYVFNLNPSWIYKWKWPLFILEILVFYGLFFVLHILINKIRIYISYFIFSITESDNAVILINHKQNIIAFNSRVEDILGLANAVKRQQNYQKTLQNRNEIVAVIDESINKKAPVKKEISYDTFNKNFIGTVKVSPFKSYFNFINAYLVEIQDNTDQILNERQMNWQRNLRRMIHDIKNPLAGVQFKLQSIYLKMSDKDPELAAELEGEIEIANSEIKRIRNISKDFLKFSNLEAIQPRFLKLDELIIRCINHFRAYQNNNLKIQNIIDDKIPEVFWDARQIELLLHIVIENAIDAVKGSGQLLLKTELVQNLNIIEEEFVKIMIADTGCGIEEEDINKIFQPNFSLKPEGSGMGLVFAKQIVQQHKGSIWLEKFEGFSTAFIISIPAIPKTG